MFVSSAHAATTTDTMVVAQNETPAPAEHGAAPDAHGGETHTETGVPHQTGTFPPFDSTFFASQVLWLAITFALFYWFLSKVILPRIGGLLETRRSRIFNDLDQANRMKQDSDDALAAYEQELAEAKKKAGVIAQAARDEAKSKADAEQSAIAAALEKRLSEAEAHIASIKDKAMKDVGTIAEDTATDIIRKIVGGAIDTSGVPAAVKAIRG